MAKVRGEPVHALLGGPVRDELQFYMTTARPDFAKEQGFIGGKMPLHHGPAEGDEGLKKNLAQVADMRARCGDDFWLMLDCWMSLDVEYATRLAHGVFVGRPGAQLRSLKPGLVFVASCDAITPRWFTPRRLVIECDLRSGEPVLLRNFVEDVVIELAINRQFG